MQGISKAVRVTNDTDYRVERALKSKVAETAKLKDIIEDSIEGTNAEISKMNALKKYLAQQRDFHERHLGHSLERREQRSQRPPRELVHDVPYRELKKQTGLLQNTDRRFIDKIIQVEDSVGELKKFRHQLAKDLDDKRAALTVDKTCIDMVAGDVKIQEMENHCTTGLPYGWKKETMHVVEDAEVARRQAEKLRKICFRAAQKHSELARDQHDALQASFVVRMKSILRVKEKLEEQLTQVEDEIEKAQKVKSKLKEAISEKVSPLSLARSRYALRLKRPHREAIHDKVEHALLLQVNELQALVQDLENKEHQVKEHLAGLDRTRSELMRNIHDKDKNLKLEHTCYGLAPSRPATGKTLNTDALSLRPATASTLGGFTIRTSGSQPTLRSLRSSHDEHQRRPIPSKLNRSTG